MNTELFELMPGAEPIYLSGNKVGCLILHGFLASPDENRWLGEYLAERGYTVYIPRHAGMGIYPEAVRHLQWQDWYGSALDAYHMLKQQCEQVFIIGHSMGGMLALLLASHVESTALVLAATPFKVVDPRAKYAGWLKYILPYTDQSDTSELQEIVRREQERRGEPVRGRVRYDKWSSNAVHQMYEMMQLLPEMAKQVTVPTLLLYATHDETAPTSNIDFIEPYLQRAQIEKQVLEQGGHIIFQDEAREEAFKIVAEFVARHTK